MRLVIRTPLGCIFCSQRCGMNGVVLGSVNYQVDTMFVHVCAWRLVESHAAQDAWHATEWPSELCIGLYLHRSLRYSSFQST